MRTIILVITLFTAVSNSAKSAEKDWTGYHVSPSANASRSDEDIFPSSVVVVRAPAGVFTQQKLDYDSSGFGLEGGYVYDFSNGWVVGVDLKYDMLDVTDGNTKLVPELSEFLIDEPPVGVSIGRTFSVRPKIGYAAKNVLFYVGPEWVRSELSLKSFYQDPAHSAAAPNVKSHATHVAWSGGVDWRFSNNWSLGFDYRKASSFEAGFDIDQNSYTALYLSRPATNLVRRSYNNINYEQLNIRMSYHF
jgi:opacity protein-like surface antigen